MADQTPWGIVTPEQQAQVQAISRQRALADALMKQSQIEQSPTQNAGRYVVPFSPMQGIRRGAQGLLAKKLGGDADEAQTGLTMQRQALLKALGQQMYPDDQVAQQLFMHDPASAVEHRRALELEKVKASRASINGMPSSVEEYEYFMKLDEAGKQQFMQLKRAQQIRDLGGSVVGLSQIESGKQDFELKKTPPPEQMPSFKGAQTSATERAKADVELSLSAPKTAALIRTAEGKTANLNETIGKAKKQSGPWTTGFAGAITSKVPGGEAYDLAENIKSIKANLGFDELQEMRVNSPTGGALGQVAVQEINYLQSVIASLEQAQSKEQFDAALDKVMRAKAESNERIKKAYQETYGKPYGGASEPAPSGGKGGFRVVGKRQK